MLGKQELIDEMNAQIGRELAASMQYLEIAAHFDGESLPELARFFYRQAEEEHEHAMRFLHFVIEVGGTVAIPEIPAPKSTFQSALECAELSLDWEIEVTKQIYRLVDLAKEDGDYIALRFLDWFVDEQREEVSVMDALVNVIKRAGEDQLLLVENYLARENLNTEGSDGDE